MSISVPGMLPILLGDTTQPHPKDNLEARGRPAARKARAKPRDSGLRPSAADDDAMAALRWARPSRQPGDLRGAPHVAWSDYTEQPGPQRKACSLLGWSESEEARDGDSSVSSGRLSGSSGGHESCTSLPGPWKERPPQVQGPRWQLRESNPRLERLRDKIRAQAQWQASCASLGTSTPSSASRLYRVSKPHPRRKAGRLAHPDPAPWDVLGPGATICRMGTFSWNFAQPVSRCSLSSSPGLGTPSEAPCGAEDKAIPGRGREPSRVPQRQASAPREKTKRMKSRPCTRERAPQSPTSRRDAKDTDSELVGVYAWRKGPALARALLGPPPALRRLQREAPSRDQAPAAELGDSKKVGAAKSSPARPRMPSPASVRGGLQVSANTPNLPSCEQPVTIQNAMAVLRDLRQQIQAGLELAWSHRPRGGPELGRSKLWLQNLAERRQQGPWSTPDVRGSFSKSPRALERAGSFPTGHRWSTVAGWESCPQMTRAAQGRNPSFQRPGSPPERLTSFPQRPWSASAGQPSQPQRTWAAHEDWESSAQSPWSPAAQRPWSASFLRSKGTPCRGRGSLPPPSEPKRDWMRPAPGAPRNAPGKENEVRVPPPCPKPRGVLGHPYSSESLREFMRQKALARRRQALEEKASALRALELRNQRLQDVYRKQREAVLGKAVPVVSHTTPGIVTFFPHCAQSEGLEASGSLGSPVLEWSKVTSGMVLGDQEAPGSFCLCLNRALNRTETLGTGGPTLMSARSSLGPLKLQDLATQGPRPGVCIYLDPEESERLGTSGPLHFRYKQARLQALETMANVLKQRIDILMAQLHKSEAPDPPGDPVSDPSPSYLSRMAAAPTPTAPVHSGALVPRRGGGTPWDWADTQARPPASPTCFPDGRTPSWSPDWERRHSVSPGAPRDSQPRGLTEDGCSEPDNRLARNTDSFQALRPFTGSSLGVTAMLDPTCDSLRLEMPSARGAGLLTPWTTRSCGQRSGHLANIPQKSLGFLESLKLDQQKRKQALALLRQRAKREVWETQKALDKLLFKHRVQQLMGKHSTEARPKPASEGKQPQVCGGLEPVTCLSTVTARPRSHPAQGRAAAAPSQDPREGQQSREGKSAPAEPRQEERPDQAPSQLPLARLYPQDNPTHQMLDVSLREEELRAQHQAAMLRLREKALEEKMRTELAWLEHQRECLGGEGKDTMLAALATRQEQALGKLEQEQREIRYLRDIHLFSHQERKLLLQHEKDIVSLQRSMVHLRRELQARNRLPQSSGREVKTTQTEGSETSVQLKGPAQGSSRPLSPPGPASPASHCPRTSPETPRVQQPLGRRPQPSPGCDACCPICGMLWSGLVPREGIARVGSPSPALPYSLLSERADGTPPQATSAAESHRPPPRPAWGEDTPVAGSWPDAGRRLAESHSPVGQGDPQTNPSPTSAEEKTRPLTDSRAQKLQGPNSPGGGGPCGPLEASVVEGRVGRAGSELGLDFAGSPVEEPHRMEGWWPGEQRTERCGPFSPPEAAQLTTAPGEAPPCTRTMGPPPAGPPPPAPPRPEPPFPQSPAGEPRPLAIPIGWPPKRRTVGRAPVWSRRAPINTGRLQFGGGAPKARRCPPRRGALTCAGGWVAELTAPVPPSWPEGSPLPPLRAPSDPGPESEAAPRSRSGSWAGSPASSSPSGVSCRSLQEFQRAAAVLVQLSESPVSVSDWGGGDVPDTDPGCSGELSPQDSWGLHRGGGQVARERPEGGGAGPLGGPSTEPGGVLREGWPLPPPDAPSPRSGSELSEASSEVWDEENLLEPGSGPSLSTGGSSHLENGGAPGSALASLGPGEGQEASGSTGSLIRELTTEEGPTDVPRGCPHALPSTPSSSSDLDLSLSSPSGSLASEGVGFGRGETRPLQASAACPEGLWDAALSLPSDRTPRQPWSEPEVPVTSRAPPGDPGGLVALTPQGWAPRGRGSGDSPAPEEACPTPSSRALPEILSPVDEVLSYGSADLSSAHRDARLPPLPPTFPAEGLADTTSPDSGDFPSPPEDVMSPGSVPGPPGEDASIKTGELPSLSEEDTPEAPSPGPRESGLCLGAGRQGGSLGDELGESSSVSRDQAVGSRWPDPAGWPGRPSGGRAGDAPGGPPRLPVRPPTLSRGAFMAGERPPMLAAAGSPGQGDPAPALGAGPCADPPGTEGAKVLDLVSSQLSGRILCDTLAVLLEPAQPAAP
ncbi:coiled-coil domain-containing protein 187 [Lynx canadensis]|uniref:coiled-coil domain-containing protein 187 n=1 Tax=Lynx canadensis TaxID=61383 RepID=UPI0013C4BAB8|nr:coiled-coil domain-containing protein 187 [Lynx canadensis]